MPNPPPRAQPPARTFPHLPLLRDRYVRSTGDFYRPCRCAVRPLGQLLSDLGHRTSLRWPAQLETPTVLYVKSVCSSPWRSHIQRRVTCRPCLSWRRPSSFCTRAWVVRGPSHRSKAWSSSTLHAALSTTGATVGPCDVRPPSVMSNQSRGSPREAAAEWGRFGRFLRVCRVPWPFRSWQTNRSLSARIGYALSTSPTLTPFGP